MLVPGNKGNHVRQCQPWRQATAALLQVGDDLLGELRCVQLVDAVFTVGQYNLVSWALNAFGVPLDDFLPGAEP